MSELKIPVYQIKFPEYQLKSKPDYASIGKKLDYLIIKNFPNKWIAVRGISLQDHPKMTLFKMASIIKKLGTDRYDSTRKPVHFDMYKKFNVELQAIPIIAKRKVQSPHYTKKRCKTGSVFAEIIKDLYEGAIADRGYPLRIDIITIYDIDKLKAAPMKWKGDKIIKFNKFILPLETSTFQFKDSKNKKNALIGIIKLL